MHLSHAIVHLSKQIPIPVTGILSLSLTKNLKLQKLLDFEPLLIFKCRDFDLSVKFSSCSEDIYLFDLLTLAVYLLQVLSISRSLSKLGIPFRSMVATGGFRQKTQLENLKQELDVLIATPGRFMFLMKEGFLQFKNLKWYTKFLH